MSSSCFYASNLAWTMVGVAVAAILAWLPWQAAYGQLPSQTRLQYAWISPTLVVAAIAGAVLAGVAFAFSHTTRRLESVSVTGIVRDMDALHPSCSEASSLPATSANPSRRVQSPSGLLIVGGEWGISGNVTNGTSLLRSQLTAQGSEYPWMSKHLATRVPVTPRDCTLSISCPARIEGDGLVLTKAKWPR
jgi:hypothetical protein